MIKYIFPFLFLPLVSFAQIGGSKSYEYLLVPVNARTAAVGGINVSLRDQDVNMFMQNPAAINKDMRKNLSINYVPYVAGIKATSLAYGLAVKNNTLGLGLTYFDYGQIVEAEANGNLTGATFKVREYALNAAASHQIENYVIGFNLKFAGSDFVNYNSHAILGDLGGMFVHPKRQWTIGLAFKNIGYAFDSYSSTESMKLPFDVQLGTSYKLEHMPLRFSLTAHHLQQFDIVYLDPNKKAQKDLEGNEIKEEKKFGDQVLRHFIVGGEFLLSKNFNLRVGYNHMRRKELRLKEKSAGAGFSFGGMIRISSFEFAYTRAFYSVAGASNYITLTTNFNSLLKKRDRKNTKSEISHDGQ